MNKIFRDNELNQEFIKYGYVILNDKLSMDFKKVYDFFNSLESKVDNKFYSSLWSSDNKYRTIVDSEIKRILTPFCESYLDSYLPFFSDLLVKKPSLNHKLNWHQDWTFTDERLFTQVFFWAPLQDVTIRNGCIMILPKSHLFFNSLRGGNIPSGLDYNKLNELEKKYAQYIVLKKGDILVFNQSLLHASLPNRSLKNRLALGLYCLPKDAPKYHYHYDQVAKRILRYHIDLDFIIQFSANQDFKNNILNQSMSVPAGEFEEFSVDLIRPFFPEVYERYESELTALN